MKMRLLKEINKKQSGQAFILVLILLLVGGLIIVPLLGFMSTGLNAGRNIEQRVDEVYADDAGIEDAIWKILNGDFEDLGVDEASDPYTLTVNGLTVTVTVTKLSLLESLVMDEEYNENAPHEEWVEFDIPPDEKTFGTDGNGDYVEYTCFISFYYNGDGNRSMQSVGAFFFPLPGDETSVDGPYDYNTGLPGLEEPWDEAPWGVMHFNNLEENSPEVKFTSGGFAFIWRWETAPPQGPLFDDDNQSGGFVFRFKVYEPSWEPSISFIWSTFQEQDVSYVTNAPGFYRWLIEATTGDTEVRAALLETFEGMGILTWEINPPE